MIFITENFNESLYEATFTLGEALSISCQIDTVVYERENVSLSCSVSHKNVPNRASEAWSAINLIAWRNHHHPHPHPLDQPLRPSPSPTTTTISIPNHCHPQPLPLPSPSPIITIPIPNHYHHLYPQPLSSPTTTIPIPNHYHPYPQPLSSPSPTITIRDAYKRVCWLYWKALGKWFSKWCKAWSHCTKIGLNSIRSFVFFACDRPYTN